MRAWDSGMLIHRCPDTGCDGNYLDDCILQTMQPADDSIPLGKLRLKCKEQIKAGSFALTKKDGTELPVVEDRIHQDKKHVLQPAALYSDAP